MNSRWRRYFGWSKSRAGVFRECRKRYSFQYLFKWEPGEAAAMAKRLGKLATLAITKGSLVHEEIEHFLKIRQGRGQEDVEGSRRRLAAAYDRLAADAAGQLLEVRFGFVTPAEAQERLAGDRLDALRQFDAFLDEHWPRYRDLEVLGFETLEKFTVEGTPVWVSADLVVRTPEDEVLLVDWKTGKREHDADDSEQLTAYLLWARDRFAVPLERLAAELVWLDSGRVDRTRRDQDAVTAMAEVMRADAAEMLALESYDQIVASPEAQRCRRCPFLPLCREGAPFLDEAVRREALGALRAELRGGA